MIYRAHHNGEEFVSLTDHEIDIAAYHGALIFRKSQRDWRANRPTVNGDGRRIQMLGAVAERAAAKALGIYWPSAVDQGGLPDLPHEIEVRMIGIEHYGLRVRPRDPDDRRVVGVVIPRGGERAPYRLPGWILAGDAKRKEWLMDPNGGGWPFYAVPQHSLRPLAELREWVLLEGLAQAVGGTLE